MVVITFLENTQLNEYRVLVRMSSACHLRLLVDGEQSFELCLRFRFIPIPIFFFRCFEVCRMNGACSARARRARFSSVSHAREDSCM